MSGLTRKHLGNLYRPIGVKAIQLGIPFVKGGTFQLAQGIDLSLPLRGFRMVFKGQMVIGTADYTSVTPEGFLNLLPRVQIFGTNSRQGGNVTLLDMDLATLYVSQCLTQERAGQFDVAATELSVPTTPFPTTYGNAAQGTYNFRIVVDIPLYPYNAPASVRPQFIMRQDEWSDSVTLKIQMATLADNATNEYGVSASTTTTTLHAFGSSSGSPTIDIYGLPMILGQTLKNTFVPGFISRVSQPISTILQSAGNNVTLMQLQKQPTSRVFLKIGTSTLAPSFATLSDTNLTQAGILLGGNRVVREVDDIFAHKQGAVNQYHRAPIQGYFMFDFIESGNPDSAYPGDLLGTGTTLNLTGNVTGVANAAGIIVQEQVLYTAEGPLYSF